MEWYKMIWLIVFVLWGLLVVIYRSRFRKLVYQTDSWVINIKPIFGKEIKALFRNPYPGDLNYVKIQNGYRICLIVYALLFLVYFNINTMKVIEGGKVPSFELKNQNGELFSVDSVLAKKNLVIYFYPKDDTPGCTKEACTFRDQFAVFADADAMIIGISAQSPESHLSFAQKHRLNFTLLSDSNNRVRKLFGVKGDLFGMIPGRVTYIINKEGRVVYVFDSQFDAEKHVHEALRVLKSMK